MCLLEIDQLAEQLVVLGIGDDGIVEHIVSVVVTVDFLTQPVGTCCRAGRIRSGGARRIGRPEGREQAGGRVYLVMIKVRCPICGKAFEIAKLDDLPSFPFCSDRCKLIDLGRWIDGSYAVPDAAPIEPVDGPDEVGPEVEED